MTEVSNQAEEAVVAEAPVADIPMLELPNAKIPIASLPPELQEMVDIYKSWLAGQQAAISKVMTAEQELIQLKRNSFLFEAAMKSLSEEIMKRVEVFQAEQDEAAEEPAAADDSAAD